MPTETAISTTPIIATFPVVGPLPCGPAWERGGDDDDVDREELDERAPLRNASPHECRRSLYSAYAQSSSSARRSFDSEKIIEERVRQTRVRSAQEATCPTTKSLRS